MLMEIKEEHGFLIYMNGERYVRIPPNFFLPDALMVIRQEREGMVTVQPDQSKLTPEQLHEWNRACWPGWFDDEA